MVPHECAILGKGQTMHSSGQMEHHRNLVHDKSMKVGGLQCVITNSSAMEISPGGVPMLVLMLSGHDCLV